MCIEAFNIVIKLNLVRVSTWRSNRCFLNFKRVYRLLLLNSCYNLSLSELLLYNLYLGINCDLNHGCSRAYLAVTRLVGSNCVIFHTKFFASSLIDFQISMSNGKSMAIFRRTMVYSSVNGPANGCSPLNSE